MKPVKTLVSVVVLLLALAVNTLAGEQETPGYVPPPSRVMTTSTEADTSPTLSDPYSEQSGETIETSDYLLFETLTALLYLY
jgi:hypothetical protein